MSQLSPARQLALVATRQIRERDAYAKPVYESVIEGSEASAEDRSFAMLLTCGTVSCTCVLDEIIDRNLDKPTDIKPDVRDALRLSVYEMFYLGKSSYAAVSQGVELVRSVAPRAAGLANAVLRRIARNLQDFPWGDPAVDDAALARLHGFPLWMTELLISQRGREVALSLLESCDSAAPIYVAANPFKLDDAAALDLLLELDPETRSFGAEGCFLVTDAASVLRSSAIEQGELIVADAAAQCVARIARPAGTGAFLEVASGRGTKTVLLQGGARRSFAATAPLYALDIYPFKQEVLRKRLELCGVPDVKAICGDAIALDDVEGLPATFDAAFIDAPCSGLGTLRRHPEQRMRITPESIQRTAELGLSMLAAVSRKVRVGGSIVYATCSLAREENEDIVSSFLASPAGKGWGISSVEADLPEDFAACLTPEGCFQSIPAPGGPDGHFAVRFVRTK